MKIVLIILGVLVLAFIILMYRLQAKMKKTPMVADHKEIITLTAKNFQQQIKNKTILIDFWAAWCAPCRMMAPVLNEVADELTGDERVGKLEINRFVGIKNRDFLLKQIRNV